MSNYVQREETRRRRPSRRNRRGESSATEQLAARRRRRPRARDARMIGHYAVPGHLADATRAPVSLRAGRPTCDDRPAEAHGGHDGREADVNESRPACGPPEKTPRASGRSRTHAQPEPFGAPLIDMLPSMRAQQKHADKQNSARQCHYRDQRSQPPAHGHSSLSRGNLAARRRRPAMGEMYSEGPVAGASSRALRAAPIPPR